MSLPPIAPGTAPGGLVFEVTGADGELVARGEATPATHPGGGDVEAMATDHGLKAAAHAARTGRRVVLVVYDGDSGEPVHAQAVDP